MVDVATQSESERCRESVSCSSQCDLLLPPAATTDTDTQYDEGDIVDDDEVEEVYESSDEDVDEADDPEWHMSAAECSEDSSTCEEENGIAFEELLTDNNTPYNERKFIAFESCLRDLLLLCFTCHSQCVVFLTRVVGSMVVLQQRCTNGHVRQWSSQPCTGTMPYGNLAAAASLFFNGCSPVKFLNICHHLRLSMIKQRTFNIMQSNYLITAVNTVWERTQRQMLQSLKGKNCVVGAMLGVAPQDTPLNFPVIP